MHGHTYFSKDSRLKPRQIVRRARAMGLDVICITDHNEIGGAFEVAALDDLPVIIGEEVRTREGEIIGLFLREHVAPQMSPQETIAAIKGQGGVVYVPHPFDSYRGSRLDPKALRNIVDLIDVVEVFNARNLRSAQNDAARAFAQEHHLLMGAGSDSHTLSEIGHAYVQMPPFDGAAQFLYALKEGVPRGRLSSPLVHVLTRFDKVYKRLQPDHRHTS